MSWESTERNLQRGPIVAGCVIVFIVAFFGCGISAAGYFLGWFTEAAHVAQKEFGAAALLKKYEWFKDAAASLDKKRADIQVFDSRLKGIESAYTGKPRSAWPRDERENYNLWTTELAGVKAAYNSLAAEYNAAMAKINWSFANAGSVPAGGQPLPRDFAAYEGK